MNDIVRLGMHTVPRDLPNDPQRIGWFNIPRDVLTGAEYSRIGWFRVPRETWVASGAPRITSPASVSVQVGGSVNYQIAATNSPDSFAATGLPAWLSINTATGLITGTAPAAAGNHSFTVSATNAEGTGSRGVQVRVTAAPPVALNAYYGSSNLWLVPPSPPELDEAYIKGLTVRANPAVGTVMAVTVPVGGRTPVFAYPATLPPASQLIQQGLGMNVVAGFQQATVTVNGVAYRVYYAEAEFAMATSDTFTMTI